MKAYTLVFADGQIMGSMEFEKLDGSNDDLFPLTYVVTGMLYNKEVNVLYMGDMDYALLIPEEVQQ